MRAAVALAVLLGGCLQSAAVPCDDGRTCPPGNVCYTNGRCLLQEQLDRCAGQSDGEPCTFTGVTDGVCHGGVCFPRGCGDDFVNAPEDCEPAIAVTDSCAQHGFQDPGPVGCKPDCTFDFDACTGYCGDGRIGGFEACDPGGFGIAPELGDATCVTVGFYEPAGLACTPGYCTFDTSACGGGWCGDGIKQDPELCEPSLGASDVCLDIGYDAGRIGCSAICAYDLSPCRRVNWHPITPPTPKFIYAMWGSSEQDVWAVGALGLILRWDGTMWSMMTAPAPTKRLRAVWGAAPDAVWAVGETGTIAYFDGTTWTPQTSPVTSQLRGVWGTAANNVWAVGEGGTLIHYNGTAWTDRSSSLGAGSIDVIAIRGTSANDIWAVGGTTGVSGTQTIATQGFVARYDGATWHTSLTDASLDPGDVQQWRGVYARSTTDVFIVGTGRNATTAPGTNTMIRHFNGATWTAQEVTTTHWFNQIAEYATGELVAVGNGGAIAHYNGRSWLYVDGGTNQDLQGVWASGTHGFAGGESGTIVRIDNHDLIGRVPSPASSLVDLFAIHGTSLDDIWIAGRDGFIAHFDGTTWSELRIDQASTNLPATSELIGLWSAPGIAIAVGVYKATTGDGAAVCEIRGDPLAPTTFTCVRMPGPSGIVTAALLGVWGASASDVWAAGDRGRLVHYNGSTWDDRTGDVPVSALKFKDVFGIDTDHVFAPAGDGELAIYTAGTWSVNTSSTAGLVGAWGTAANAMWFVGASGTIVQYDGSTLTELDSGTPEQLIEIHGTSAHVLATGRNGVLVERRQGVWSPVRSPLNIDLNGVIVFGDTALVVGDGGRILEYRWY